MARRTFAQIKTEHIQRVGRTGDTAYAARAERFITAAYLDIAQTFHHHELDGVATGVLTVGVNTLAIPADGYLLMALTLRNPATGIEVPPPTWADSHWVFSGYRQDSRLPTQWSRFGSTIYFDAKPDLAYPYSLFYYKQPAEPSYAAGSSVLDEVWDEHILEYSILRAKVALWYPELAQAVGELFSSFATNSPQGRLKDLPLADSPRRPTIDQTHGGDRP